MQSSGILYDAFCWIRAELRSGSGEAITQESVGIRGVQITATGAVPIGKNETPREVRHCHCYLYVRCKFGNTVLMNQPGSTVVGAGISAREDVSSIPPATAFLRIWSRCLDLGGSLLHILAWYRTCLLPTGIDAKLSVRFRTLILRPHTKF